MLFAKIKKITKFNKSEDLTTLIEMLMVFNPPNKLPLFDTLYFLALIEDATDDSQRVLADPVVLNVYRSKLLDREKQLNLLDPNDPLITSSVLPEENYPCIADHNGYEECPCWDM